MFWERERESKYREHNWKKSNIIRGQNIDGRLNGKLIWQYSLLSFVTHVVLDRVSFMLATHTSTLHARLPWPEILTRIDDNCFLYFHVSIYTLHLQGIYRESNIERGIEEKVI